MEVYPIDKFKDKTIIVEKNSASPTNQYYITTKYQQYIESILLSRGTLIDRIERIAYDMIQKYQNKQITFLVILKGAIFFADILNEKLCELLKVNYNENQMDFVFDYVTISSMEGTKSSGIVKLKSDLSVFENLKGKDVVIIEDIYDTGRSCATLLDYINKYEPKSIEVAFLFHKMNLANLKYNLMPEFIGFLIPDMFVAGVGMDYNDQFRDLNHLCVINEKAIETFKR